jgi:lipopolysaccharide transport system ATP-binding protein
MSAEVMVRADEVSKKFCRSLKRSLWYGVQDMVGEANPFGNGRGGPASARQLRYDEFWAVERASFELRRGECLGLVGRNGAGKTTLLKILNGLIRPDAGRVEIRGRMGALIALGAGFNPILTGRENVYINWSVLGLSKSEIDGKIDEIVDFAELEDFIDTPVQNYSSGMQVRLGFAVATSLEPDVLLLDEVLAVGDAAFRTKCFQRIGKILDRAAVIFVSHDAVQVSRVCDTCLYLKSGKQVSIGPTNDVLEQYIRDQPVGEIRKSVVVEASEVEAFASSPGEASVGWGGNLDVRIELVLKHQKHVGLALLALLDGETSVAQADVTTQLNDALRDGRPADFRMGPLNLRAGSYGLAITILNEGRKSTLVHTIGSATVQVSGPRGYGVAYQIPVATTSGSA